MTMADPRPVVGGKSARQHKHLSILSAIDDLGKGVELVETLWADIVQEDGPPSSDIAVKTTQAPSLKEMLDTTPSILGAYYNRLAEAVENIRRELFHG